MKMLLNGEGVKATQNQPLIGIPFQENGKEVILYFSEEEQADKFVFRHGSNALDTFVLVLRKHCQVGLALSEPCHY